MTVSNKSIVSAVRRAGLPETFRDIDLSQVLEGSAARRHGLVKRALACGDLVRVRRGLYLLGEVYRKEKVHPFQLAQWIYGPSYISFESALSYWDLIPESVETVTCATFKRSKDFRTPLGAFTFTRLPVTPLFFDVKRIEEEGTVFFVANPLRALIDYVYLSRRDWTLKTLSESLRIEELPPFDREKAHAMNDLYRNQRVVRFIDSCLEHSNEN